MVGVFQIQTGPPDTEDPTDPTNLVASNITSNSADLDWTASTDNVGVTHYNIFIDGNLVGTSPTNSFTVTGLFTPTTTYTAEVNAEDAAGNTSNNASTMFTTTIQMGYCSSASMDFSQEYIKSVRFGTIINSSVGSTYSDFTNLSTNLDAGSNYTIRIRPQFPGSSMSEGYAVWIDYNDDEDFTDPGELVFSAGPTSSNMISGTVSRAGRRC